jgi:hypothetical protein
MIRTHATKRHVEIIGQLRWEYSAGSTCHAGNLSLVRFNAGQAIDIFKPIRSVDRDCQGFAEMRQRLALRGLLQLDRLIEPDDVFDQWKRDPPSAGRIRIVFMPPARRRDDVWFFAPRLESKADPLFRGHSRQTLPTSDMTNLLWFGAYERQVCRAMRKGKCGKEGKLLAVKSKPSICMKESAYNQSLPPK